MGDTMKDIHEVLRRKQAQYAELGKQIEALQGAAETLKSVAGCCQKMTATPRRNLNSGPAGARCGSFRIGISGGETSRSGPPAPPFLAGRRNQRRATDSATRWTETGSTLDLGRSDGHSEDSRAGSRTG